jgi:hypothetical protein
MERAAKSLIVKRIDGLSAVPPVPYQARFQEFISTQVLKPALETEDSAEDKRAKFISSLLL